MPTGEAHPRKQQSVCPYTAASVLKKLVLGLSPSEPPSLSAWGDRHTQTWLVSGVFECMWLRTILVPVGTREASALQPQMGPGQTPVRMESNFVGDPDTALHSGNRT